MSASQAEPEGLMHVATLFSRSWLDAPRHDIWLEQAMRAVASAVERSTLAPLHVLRPAPTPMP
jgi:hypothetical protein